MIIILFSRRINQNMTMFRSSADGTSAVTTATNGLGMSDVLEGH